MIKAAKVVLVLVVILTVGAIFFVWWLTQHGISARTAPTALEEFVALRLRRLAIPRKARDEKNPIRATPELLAEGRAHFADHCAICHANDGSGQTDFGQNLYPKPPDLRQSRTQSLSDGELFYIIHNGIRFTGMPAFGGGKPEEDKDSWELVHFIRHLPEITKQELEEMKKFNPVSRMELMEEREGEETLEGETEKQPHRHRHRH